MTRDRTATTLASLLLIGLGLFGLIHVVQNTNAYQNISDDWSVSAVMRRIKHNDKCSDKYGECLQADWDAEEDTVDEDECKQKYERCLR